MAACERCEFAFAGRKVHIGARFVSVMILR